MDKILKNAVGVNGQIELLEDRIRLKRKGVMGALSFGFRGDKEIFIKDISSIQFRKAGFTNGYIQFAFYGGKESKGGFIDATLDENSVVFNAWQQKPFEEIKSVIEEIKRKQSGGVKKDSDLDNLEKLANLKNKGIITEEEFQKKKKEILGL